MSFEALGSKILKQKRELVMQFRRLGRVTWRLTENNRFVNIRALETKKQNPNKAPGIIFLLLRKFQNNIQIFYSREMFCPAGG